MLWCLVFRKRLAHSRFRFIISIIVFLKLSFTLLKQGIIRGLNYLDTFIFRSVCPLMDSNNVICIMWHMAVFHIVIIEILIALWLNSVYKIKVWFAEHSYWYKSSPVKNKFGRHVPWDMFVSSIIHERHSLVNECLEITCFDLLCPLLPSTIWIISDLLNHQSFAVCIRIDLRTAFETVERTILFYDSYHYRIIGNTLRWFNSCLNNKYQYVNCNKTSTSM